MRYTAKQGFPRDDANDEKEEGHAAFQSEKWSVIF